MPTDVVHGANLDVYQLILQANFPHHILIDIGQDLRRAFGPGNPQHARFGELLLENGKEAFEFRSLLRKKLDEIQRPPWFHKPLNTRGSSPSVAS